MYSNDIDIVIDTAVATIVRIVVGGPFGGIPLGQSNVRLDEISLAALQLLEPSLDAVVVVVVVVVIIAAVVFVFLVVVFSQQRIVRKVLAFFRHKVPVGVGLAHGGYFRPHPQEFGGKCVVPIVLRVAVDVDVDVAGCQWLVVQHGQVLVLAEFHQPHAQNGKRGIGGIGQAPKGLAGGEIHVRYSNVPVFVRGKGNGVHALGAVVQAIQIVVAVGGARFVDSQVGQVLSKIVELPIPMGQKDVLLGIVVVVAVLSL